MPRDGSDIYHIPPGTEGVPDSTIESDKYNAFIHDVETDLNAPRPIVAGGTGANSADDALGELGAEKASQQVVNYDSHDWLPGSFYSATSATSPPVASHAFAGKVYMSGADIVVEARDLTDAAHKQYVRAKIGGTWGAWTPDVPDVSGFVDAAGDTMTGPLVLAGNPGAPLEAAPKQYVDAALAGSSTPPATVLPLRLSVAGAIGVAFKYAREDHAHPSNYSDINQSLAAGVDLNTLTVAGRYSANTPVNGPASGDSWYYIDVIVHSVSPLYVTQFAYMLATGVAQHIFMRMCNNGTWGAWSACFDSSHAATAAQYLNNTAGKLLTTDAAWTAAGMLNAVDTSGTITHDMSLGINFWTTLGGNRVIANPINTKIGQTGVIYLFQDGTGGRTITSWGSSFKFPGGTKPTLSTAPNNADMISYQVFASTFIMCNFAKGMA